LYKAQLLGRTGNRCAIQASSDFSSWAPLTTISNMADTFEFTDASVTNESQRFYRAVLPP